MNPQDIGIIAVVVFGVLAIIIPVVILRWALRINTIVKNQEEIIKFQKLQGLEAEKTNKLLSDFLTKIQ